MSNNKNNNSSNWAIGLAALLGTGLVCAGTGQLSGHRIGYVN